MAAIDHDKLFSPFAFKDQTLKVPFSLQSEQAVLGMMLQDRDSCDYGLQHLKYDSFPNINNNHRIIFHAIKLLSDDSINIDLVTVTQKLETLKALTLVGGVEYLDGMIEMAFEFSALKDYVKTLEDLRLLRLTLSVIDDNLYFYRTNTISDNNEFIGKINAEITKVAENRRIGDFQNLNVIADQVTQYLNKISRSSTGTITGVNTGYVDLNKLTHGFQAGDYVIIAARPAVGKTAFALNLALNVATRGNATVGFFSVEMPSRQMMMRLIASSGMILYDRLQTNQLDSSDRIKLADTIEELKKTSIFVDETPGISINDIVIKTRKLKKEQPNLKAIFIDYIGLVTTNGRKESRQLEVSEISRTLKELARELSITVIALSQLSRGVEARVTKRPNIADLRESGSLEQDADVIMLMFREDYYLEQGSLKESAAMYASYYNTMKDKKEAMAPSLVDIMIAKNRNGEVGTVTLNFLKAASNFCDPDNETRSLISQMQAKYKTKNLGADE